MTDLNAAIIPDASGQVAYAVGGGVWPDKSKGTYAKMGSETSTYKTDAEAANAPVFAGGAAAPSVLTTGVGGQMAGQNTAITEKYNERPEVKEVVKKIEERKIEVQKVEEVKRMSAAKEQELWAIKVAVESGQRTDIANPAGYVEGINAQLKLTAGHRSTNSNGKF